MNSKRIALVGYAPDYFLEFGRALEQIGFEVYWINSLRSDANYLRKSGTAERQILDITEFNQCVYSIEECRYRLSKLENVNDPLINDIILMDRKLRNKSHEFAIKYLGHVERVVSEFIDRNRITIVSSGRDTALQLMTMLVCRRMNIPWLVPTRARIPQELFGFCQKHYTEDLIQIHRPSAEDRLWAENFMTEFELKILRPALKTSARGFSDVIRLLPIHAKVFLKEITKLIADMGNDYARYPIAKLIQMYIRRRINMLMYKLFPPYVNLSNQPFCLYALHTQPESSIDVVGSYFSDQIALITWIARSLPASHELYVKIHPTDVDGRPLSFYQRIKKLPGVRLISHSHDSREILTESSLIFTLTGTIGYEAGLMGKPVITFAKNFFNSLPSIHHCDTPTKLPELITKLLDTPSNTSYREGIIEFLTNLKSSCFKGEVNRTYGADIIRLSASDLATLQQVYEVLYQRMVIERMGQ